MKKLFIIIAAMGLMYSCGGGTQKGQEEKGKYTWNAAGNTIILDGVKDAPNQYFVGENTLTQLDMEGNKITGDMADLYILKK